MNKKTLKALKGSIEKWEKICNESGEDWGIKNCPLCHIFSIDDDDDDDCDDNNHSECPVKKESQDWGCSNTPYDDWFFHQAEEHNALSKQSLITYPLTIKCAECKTLAHKELNFLKSLLPEEKEQ